MMPTNEWYAHLERSCQTLGAPHDDDPGELYRQLLAAGITPVLVRGKLDLDGIEHVRLTPRVWERISANAHGLLALLANQAMDTAQQSLFRPRATPPDCLTTGTCQGWCTGPLYCDPPPEELS